MHQFHFLIPDPDSFPSGGNVFNRELLAAMSRLGVHSSYSIFNPNVLHASPDTLYLVDSIYFNLITDPDSQLPPHSFGIIHHLESLYPESPDFDTGKEKILLQKFERLIASSTFTRDYLINLGVDPSTILVIEPAPMIAPSDVSDPSRKINALMLGSCIPRKGQLGFLQAMADVDISPDYSLIIAGSVTADPAYARKCADVLLKYPRLKSCIRFIGEQDASVIDQLYRRANLYISSSSMETFGMSIQDAVVSHMPVLALEGGYATMHVAPGQNGHRCSTLSELAQTFKRYVLNSDLFMDLQKGAIAYAPQYQTWEEGANTLISSSI